VPLSNPCGTRPRARNSSIPSSITPAVSHLQANWHVLSDSDRAQALLPIVGAGMSRRMVADALNVSEGTVRILLLIPEANRVDQIAFRLGSISRNELIRRVRGTSNQCPARAQRCESERAESELEQTWEPAGVCREILSWLATDESRATSAYLILSLAVPELNRLGEQGPVSRYGDLGGMTTEDVIFRCRPARDRSMLPAALLARWLLTWVFSLIPDPAGCRDALNMALDRVRADKSRPDHW
jgi:hypothetical protein